jgi:hypothetical protein
MKAWTIFSLAVLLIFQTVQAQTCPNGQNYNSQLNRCLTSNQTAKIKGATAHCMSQANESARKACYKKSAQTVIDENEAELTDVDESVVSKPFATSSSTKAILTSAVAVGVATFSIFKLSGKMKECRSPAMWLMLGGGLATAATEISTYLWLKSSLKKLEKEYEGKITSTGSQSVDQQRKEANDAQKDALEYLAKRQDIIKKVAKTKGGAYTAVAAVYAAAAVVSAIEVYKSYYGDQSGVCTGIDKTPSTKGATPDPATGSIYFEHRDDLHKIALHNLQQEQNSKHAYFLFQEYMHVISDINQSPSLIEYHSFDWNEIAKVEINFLEIAKLISSHIIPSAHAQDDNKEKKANNTDQENKIGSMITKQLVRPETRLVLNGYLAYHAGKMAAHAIKEGKKAEERAGQIRKITNEFTAGSGFVICENEDRNNPSKPTCYCYTEANTINPNRKNSAICQKVSGSSQVAQAGQYGDQIDSQFPFDKKVCVNNQNQIDHNCQCRSQVVKNGQNNCLKLQANFGGLPGLNSADFATNLTNDMNKLIGGNISAADLNAAQYGKMAAKLAAAKDNLLKQDKFKKVNDVANKLAPQMERLFESAARSGMPPLSVGGAPLMASTSNVDSIPLPAMKEEVKQMLSKNNLYDESSAKNSYDKADKPIDIGLDDIASGGVTIQDEQLQQAMNENYDYGNMDISSDNGSIFTILSNRYQMSGMRRLFKPAAQIEKKE